MSIFSEEQRMLKRGYKAVAGLDEAGRGPLAGPVTAAAVLIKDVSCYQSRDFRKTFKGLKDSKELTAKRRSYWYKIIINHPAIGWSVANVSQKIIDRINILEATKLAMKRALENLGIEPDYLLLDGNFSIRIARVRPALRGSRNANAPMRMIPCKSIIKGDEKIISCAAASIIAKVTRDRIMVKYHKKYPQYGFDRHKGYGTRVHFAAIKKHGPCQIHRLSFAPFSQR